VSTAELSPLEDSTALLGRPEELRARADRDGYLFFRGLIDAAPIFELRRAALAVLDRHGLRVPGVGPLAGKLNIARLEQLPAEAMRVDIGVSEQIYFELQQLPALHRLPHHSSFAAVYRDLFGEEVFVHPRHIMRAMTPHPATGPTPPHQDFPLVQGSPETWTCWFPVGDCSLALGPLAILRGSHRNGYLPTETGEKNGHWTDWGAQLCEHETDWVSSDFHAGDVITFPCFTVHRSIRATIRDEIRISMDVRYQRASDVIEERSLTNHSGRSWDEIYEGWPDEDADLIYYWDPDRLSLSPWDDSLLEPGARRIC
jgi:hypothetical protein